MHAFRPVRPSSGILSLVVRNGRWSTSSSGRDGCRCLVIACHDDGQRAFRMAGERPRAAGGVAGQCRSDIDRPTERTAHGRIACQGFSSRPSGNALGIKNKPSTIRRRRFATCRRLTRGLQPPNGGFVCLRFSRAPLNSKLGFYLPPNRCFVGMFMKDDSSCYHSNKQAGTNSTTVDGPAGTHSHVRLRNCSVLIVSTTLCASMRIEFCSLTPFQTKSERSFRVIPRSRWKF
jgi:hypothetical protein